MSSVTRKKKIIVTVTVAIIMLIGVAAGIIGVSIAGIELEERRMEVMETQALVKVGMRLDQLIMGATTHHPDNIYEKDAYQDIFEFFKRVTGSYPTVYTDGEDGCSFIELEEGMFFCLGGRRELEIDSRGQEKLRTHLTELDPEAGGYCTPDNFSCPDQN